MNLRQILTAPNQLTLLRMIFLPFIVIDLVVATVQYDEDYTDFATYPMMDAFRALADAGATIVDLKG